MVRPTPIAGAGGIRTSAHGTRRRIQALAAIGYSQASLAKRLGLHHSHLSRLMRQDMVSIRLASKVSALYDEIWDVGPGERTPRARATAAAARRRAREYCYCPPMAWDDDVIDLPDGAPAEGWRRPARPSVADLLPDARELLSWGLTLRDAAARLHVSDRALQRALKQDCRPPGTPPRQPDPSIALAALGRNQLASRQGSSPDFPSSYEAVGMAALAGTGREHGNISIPTLRDVRIIPGSSGPEPAGAGPVPARR